MRWLVTFYSTHKKKIDKILIVLAVYFSIKYIYGLYASTTINARLDEPIKVDHNLLNRYFDSPLQFHDGYIYYMGCEGLYRIKEDTKEKTIIYNESGELNSDNEYLYFTSIDDTYENIIRYSLKDGSKKKLFRIKRETRAGDSNGVYKILLINDILVGRMQKFIYNPLEFDTGWGGGQWGIMKRNHLQYEKTALCLHT